MASQASTSNSYTAASGQDLMEFAQRWQPFKKNGAWKAQSTVADISHGICPLLLLLSAGDGEVCGAARGGASFQLQRPLMHPNNGDNSVAVGSVH